MSEFSDFRFRGIVKYDLLNYPIMNLIFMRKPFHVQLVTGREKITKFEREKENE